MGQNLNIKKPTPLVRSIPLSGGEFYTFQSAAEDMTMSFSDLNTERNFRFSKFALLNIPNISNNSSTENYLKLRANPSTYNSSTFLKTSDSNIHFIESFQNYCLNLESMLISDVDYDCTNTKTVSERVFFKWLKELGALRFAESGKRLTTSESNSVVNYIEDGGGYDYSRVVQYIGDVAYSGNQVGNNNTYTEIYINVPQNCGNAPHILFTSKEDENYKIGKLLTNSSKVSLDSEYICGRTYDTIHPDGLDIRAHFDCDEPHLMPTTDKTNYALRVYKNIDNNKVFNSPILDAEFNVSPSWQLNGWWYDMSQSISNSYYLEPDEFTNPANDIFAIYDPTNEGTVNLSNLNTLATRFIRSRLDGIEIDWDINHYNAHDWVDSTVNTTHELGVQAISQDFEFNAVLIYYDIYTNKYDSNNNISADVLSTNLFGVLFLDNVANLPNGQGEIKRFFKQRSNETLGISGNEYGFKVNLKIDTNTANTIVTHIPVISENNTMAMNVFHQALLEMTRVSNMVETHNLTMMNVMTSINELKNLTSNLTFEDYSTKILEIQARLGKLESALISEGNSTFSNPYEVLINLISDTRNRLYEFMSNSINGSLAVDLSTIIQGDGIDFSRGTNALTISAKNQNFNFTNQSSFGSGEISWKQSSNSLNVIEYYEYSLVSGNNYIQFKDDNINSYMTNNTFNIFLRDLSTKWINGQKIRISIKTPIIFRSANKKMNIYTGYDNSVGYEKFNTLIASFDTELLKRYNNTPVIEIYYTIIDDKEEFFVDIF